MCASLLEMSNSTSMSSRNESASGKETSAEILCSLSDGRKRNCSNFSLTLSRSSSRAIQSVEEIDDTATALSMQSTFIAVLYILQIIVTALLAQRGDGPEYLPQRKSRKPLTMRRYEASDTFHQNNRRKVSNKQESSHGVSTGWRSGRRYSMSACFMLVLVVSSSCISFAQAIDDNTPGFGSSSSTGRSTWS